MQTERIWKLYLHKLLPSTVWTQAKFM